MVAYFERVLYQGAGIERFEKNSVKTFGNELRIMLGKSNALNNTKVGIQPLPLQFENSYDSIPHTDRVTLSIQQKTQEIEMQQTLLVGDIKTKLRSLEPEPDGGEKDENPTFGRPLGK